GTSPSVHCEWPPASDGRISGPAQMSALRPFIPGVHEQQAFLADEEFSEVVQLLLDIHLECLGCRADEAVAALRLAWRVVPAGKHGGVALVARQSPAGFPQDRGYVIVAGADEVVPDDGRRIRRLHRTAVRRELDAAVEAEVCRRPRQGGGF